MRSILLLLFIGSFFNVDAQNNHVFFNQNTVQRSHINPAAINDMEFAISTGLQVDAYSNGVNYGDLFSEGANGNSILDEDKILNSIEENLDVYGDISVNIIDAYLKLGGLGLSGGVGQRSIGGISLPRGIADLYFKGNAPFIGEEVVVQPLLSAQEFTQVYLGLHTQIGGLDVAVRGKWLNGDYAASIAGSGLSLTTSDDIYQLSFNGTSTFNYADNTSGNNGFALDIGLQYNINESTSISASLMDVGGIDYKDGNNYTVDSDSHFDGLDLVDYIKDDTKIDIEDTLKSFIGYDETNDPFSITLPARLNIGVIHEMSEKSSLGLLLATRFINDKAYSTVAVNYSQRILPFLRGSVLYSARDNSYTNIGLQFSANLGRLHAFITSDDILGVFNLDHADQSSFGLGLSYKI